MNRKAMSEEQWIILIIVIFAFLILLWIAKEKLQMIFGF
jgi:hypothetical protein